MTEYRDRGTIYKSFREPLETIKTYKEKYFYLKSVMELSLYGEIISKNKEENLRNYNNFAEEILQNLDKKKMFLSKLALINLIPNARNCYSQYLKGMAGKEYGHLGGAPKGNKNASKNNPKTTPDIEEEKDIDKENRVKNKSIEIDISDKNTLKKYGYNGNVVLTGQNIITFNDYLYRNLSTHIQIDEDIIPKVLELIINELDRNIENGKENKYTPDSNPLQHYVLIQQYIKQKLKEENINDFINTIQQLQQGEYA